MRHVVVERWSRGSSPLHARDARAKFGALLAFLIAVSTTRPASQAAFAGYAALLAIAIAVARLPALAILARAAVVLPFSGVFALIVWWSGEPLRALALGEKSFLSAIAALLLAATTPLPELLRALDKLKIPRALILSIQFLYRYLFVALEQAQRMRHAVRARGARFGSAAGALAVLFARSFARAEGIYRAMLARGFSGTFPALPTSRFGLRDTAFMSIAIAVSIGIRLAL
ncbi:MAG: energy-coupling factor transporter transmembrane component T family protein [Bryobacteraceae bacterium]